MEKGPLQLAEHSVEGEVWYKANLIRDCREVRRVGGSRSRSPCRVLDGLLAPFALENVVMGTLCHSYMIPMLCIFRKETLISISNTS
jgi:hypothetical protein